MSDDPLVPLEDGSVYIHNVVDLANIRIQRGRSRAPDHKQCQHTALLYSPKERRIWCSECERTIEGFDAFALLAGNFEKMEREAKRKLRTADEAMNAAVRRRATKEIDHAWSGNIMAICCPHCRGGLLPEDFLDGGMRTSREYEMARRTKVNKDPA